MSRIPSPTEWVTIAFCAFMANELYPIWHNPPSFPVPGEVSFILWLVPVLLMRTLHWNGESGLSALGFAAIAIGGVGWLGSLNILKQLGLALSIAALVPVTPFFYFWLASALAWMPASRWLLKPIIPYHFHYARIFIGVLMIAVYWLLYLRKRKEEAV